MGTSEHAIGNIGVSEIELASVLYKKPSFLSLNLDYLQVAAGEKGAWFIWLPFFSECNAVINFERHT